MYKIWEIRARKDKGHRGNSLPQKPVSSKTPPSRQTLTSPIAKDTNKNNADNDSKQASPDRNSNSATPNNNKQTDKSPEKSQNSPASGNDDPDKVTW